MARYFLRINLNSNESPVGYFNQVDMKHRWVRGNDTHVVCDGVDLTTYVPSVEWDLMKVWSKKSNYKYPCCNEPYPDVTFHFIVSATGTVLLA